MGILNKIAQYRTWRKGVIHCTFNPEGPGVVRIHLLPPRFRLIGNPGYLVILNGYYLLPLGPSYGILLKAFLSEVNRYDGKPLDEKIIKAIEDATVRCVRTVYPFISRETIQEDLGYLIEILFVTASGDTPDAEIEELSIRSYAKNMTAPHRMDLMVSAMTDRNGSWNCNQHCRFCYAAGQKLGQAEELSTEEWKTILDRLKKAGVPMVTFTGGEPTLRKDLPELIEYAKWFVTRLNTNGILLTAELAERLKRASLDNVQITLYSHKETIHNRLVGGDHFSETVNGIHAALAAGLDVSVNTPLCRENADYVGMLAFLHELGVRYVTVSGLICTGGAGSAHELHDLTEDELFHILSDAYAYCRENDMELDFTSPGLVAREKLESLHLHVPACGAALSNMAIAPDGTVVPCQSWLGEGEGLGNLLHDSFSRIWKHPVCRKLRQMSEEEASSCPFRALKKESGQK